uniref:Putative secreted peptide n=1 Tax=Anopheles braziliensis TaxID=58242 RepID=A0A2M3ZNU9_9DIPT
MFILLLLLLLLHLIIGNSSRVTLHAGASFPCPDTHTGSSLSLAVVVLWTSSSSNTPAGTIKLCADTLEASSSTHY